MPRPKQRCGTCEHCTDPTGRSLKDFGCKNSANKKKRKNDAELLTAGGHGGQVRAGDESWPHSAPAEAKRPRFAPGFYEPFHGLNTALHEALESAAAEQQAAILAGWEKFACSELLNILMDCLTDEVKADKTRLNTVLLHFLERVSSNDLDLSPSAIEYIVRDSSVLDHTGAVVDLTAGAVVDHTCDRRLRLTNKL